MTLNHYRVLGVTQDASAEDIQHAYRTLALRYHPDRNSEPDAAVQMAAINVAYEVLGNASRRREYDRRVSRPAKPTLTNELTASILMAARDLILRSGWRVVEDNGRNLLVESARIRVRIVLLDRLDGSSMLRVARQYTEFAGVLAVCAVFVEGPIQAGSNLVAIDLMRSERHGAPIPDGPCRSLLSPFL